MNLIGNKAWSLAGLSCAILLACLVGGAEAVDIVWTGAGVDDNWNNGANWTGGFVPTHEAPPNNFEEVGVINNGDTVFINVNTTPDAAGLDLGQAVGQSGSLRILSGGSVNFVDSSGTPTGAANIAVAGAGTLEVHGGGAMSTTLLDVNSLGNVVVGLGAGSASLVSTGGMFLNGTTTVRGAGHTFSATGTVTFEGDNTLIADITSNAHTPVRTGAGAALNGSFRPQFTGVTPMPGDRWNIIDADSIAGAFALDLGAVSTPPEGIAYQLATVSGGTNGTVLQLQYNALLRLTVNSNTNAVSIASPSGETINIVGYSVLSESGILNPSNGRWNSLQDQSIGFWQEADPDATELSELVFDASDSLAVGLSPVSLGTPYAFIPTAFDEEQPDIVFEYATDSGDIRQGFVEYIGSATYNDLLLTVDPSNGNARLQNNSIFSISLLGYSIGSQNGLLQPGDGDWSSLEDQGVGDLEESAPTASFLSELVGPGGDPLALSPGESYFLGDLFDHLSALPSDLELLFVLDELNAAERIGTVIYDDVSEGVSGDHNRDGTVDAADYVAWRKNPNAFDGSPGGYTAWRTNFGATSGPGGGADSAAQGVPEPTSLASLVFAGISMFACRRLGRRSINRKTG